MFNKKQTKKIEYIICIKDDPRLFAYCGPLCEEAGVPVGMYYENKDVARWHLDCLNGCSTNIKFEIREEEVTEN